MADKEARAQLGARLRELRTKEGYTLAQFGQRIGVDGSGLSRIEKGERGIDTLLLRRAAEVLSVNLDAFFPPVETVVMASDGGAQDERVAEMINWAKALQKDLALVARFGSDVPA